jgi:hypothetical protein
MKKHKPWFDEGWSKLFHQRKHAKLQWLQDPNEINRECLKDKITELAMNSKNKNIRDLYSGINEFKRGYKPRSNFVKDENGDLLTDTSNTANRWMGYYSQILNVHNDSDVGQIEIHSAELLVAAPSHLEVEIAVAKLKMYKSPGSDQILAEVIHAGGETLVSVIHKLIN